MNSSKSFAPELIAVRNRCLANHVDLVHCTPTFDAQEPQKMKGYPKPQLSRCLMLDWNTSVRCEEFAPTYVQTNPEQRISCPIGRTKNTPKLSRPLRWLFRRAKTIRRA
jgi:hypothetical protein